MSGWLTYMLVIHESRFFFSRNPITKFGYSNFCSNEYVSASLWWEWITLQYFIMAKLLVIVQENLKCFHRMEIYWVHVSQVNACSNW